MNSPPSSSRLLAYLQLFRLPNVFTAMADIAMGFWFTHAAVAGMDWLVFALLLTASSCLYTAGMVLNDVYDLEVDRQERPQRPLPSGRISAAFAKRIGFALLMAGIVAAGIGAILNRGDELARLSTQVRPIVCALGLAGLVLLYNRILKHTAFGPIAMGGCRMLNVLLGMSASPDPWTVWNFVIAGALGIYICGVTWFARAEATTSNRGALVGAFFVILYGLAVLSQWPSWATYTGFLPMKLPEPQWTLIWIILGVILVWRFLRGIALPSPQNVQQAVKAGILGVIAIDAATVFLVHGPIPAIAIFLLMIPTLLLGAWVYST